MKFLSLLSPNNFCNNRIEKAVSKETAFFCYLCAMITKNTIKLIQSLKQQKYRKEQQLFVVEGRKMVAELMESGFEVVSLYATERYLEGNETHFEGLETVTEVQMEQMSGQDTAPGILAVARIPQQRALKGKSPLVLALDGIANPGNMGTIIRTAEWFGITDIVCSTDCVEIWNPKVIQATMGSIFRANVVYKDLPQYLAAEKERGIAVYGALLNGENLFSLQGKPQGIVVIGSESHGIRQDVLPCITHPITIPRVGNSQTESLNASIATAIIIAEMTK